MPIYTYYCDVCNIEEDLLTKYGEVVNCKECLKVMGTRLSAPRGIVKGSSNPVKQ